MSAATLTVPIGRRSSMWVSVGIGVVLVFVVVQAYLVIEAKPGDIFSGFGGILDIIRRGTPPDASIWRAAMWGAVVTLDVAILGTIASLLVSIPLGFFAAENVTTGRSAYLVARAIIAVCRTIPDVVWALLFVTAVGLGPFAACLGLAVHSVGVLARLYAEAIEDVNMAPIHALMVTGAGRTQIASQALLPTVLPSLIGLTLYRMDTNVRSSLVLGFVGGGGLGLQIEGALSLFQYRQLTALLIVMGALILGVEALAVYLRRRIH